MAIVCIVGVKHTCNSNFKIQVHKLSNQQIPVKRKGKVFQLQLIQ